MERIHHLALSNYDDGPAEGRFYSVAAKANWAVFACAYPTAESFNAAASEKVIKIAVDSFSARPSLIELSAQNITEFINRDIYALQKPGKRSFASSALVFIMKDKARIMINGNAAVFHYSGGKLVGEYRSKGAPLYGSKLNNEYEIPPLTGLDRSGNFFLLVCENEEGEIDPPVFEGDDPQSWTEQVKAEPRTSKLAVWLPPKKGLLSGLFGKKN